MDNHQGPPSQQQNGASFQDGVAAALMATEELRQIWMQEEILVTSPICLQVRHRMEELMSILFSLHPRDEVEGDLREHCHSRAGSVALEALQFVSSKSEDPEKDNPDVERDVQGAVARMAELTFALHEKEDQESIRQDIIATYAAYQRKVLRQRVTPSMTKLVARRQWKMKHAESWANQAEEEEDEEDGSHQKATHSNVTTTILGQASALIHPLIVWKSNLPPPEESPTPIRQLCADAIAILDQQSQTLTQTVAGWCLEDKRVDDFWMGQSASEAACNSSELGELDNLVDELAFACQLYDRYLSLLAPGQKEKSASVIRDLHAEWTWKYASLERYLTTQQLQSALRLAHPVQIVLGTPIQVPSVVEDAQYLSTRALERAASARSTQAIGTVAHAIASNVWSTEPTAVGGVHHALVEQKGCYKEQTNEAASNLAQSPTSSRPNSNSFASVLMGALDDDLASSTPTKSPRPSKRPPSAPSSGAFLGLGALSSSLAGGERFQQIRMDTYLCSLNGIHSASAACASLVKVLDSLLPEESDPSGKDQASGMIQLAREELFRYSKQYQLFLESQAALVVTEFCGSLQEAPVYRGNHCIPILRYYLERENYDIPTVEALQTAEDDARMNQQLIQPLQESLFLQQLEKCDSDVLVVICGEFASRLVDLFFDCLTSQTVSKQFTDWGSILLSKQVRTMQSYISKLMEKLSDGSISMLPQWERLSQVLNVLQLEKPSDWTFYHASSALTSDELQSILSLRKGFSSDAIAAVVASTKTSTST
jgi:hypothetical protein